ncbi:MAG: DUF1254 domain-containing protein [Deltaproteobacteria bacterium]|nr:DUF1254 domain-containing protein [Deltaproteobacteria bacterium]
MKNAKETVNTRIGKLSFTHDFENGYPTEERQQKLFNEMDFQRATQAYLWGLPIVALAQWQHEHENVFGAKSGDIVLYRDYADKAGILTANATTPYAGSFINLEKTGPIVIDMPEADVRGATHSMWQIATAAMTESGRYIFYPPGTEAPKVENARVFESPTNSIFFAIRLLSTDEAQRDKDLAAIKIYLLSEIDSAPETKVIDVAGRPWQGWQPRGIGYFERLADILGREPVAERDRFFINAEAARDREGQALRTRRPPKAHPRRCGARRRGDGQGKRLREAAPHAAGGICQGFAMGDRYSLAARPATRDL